MKVILQPWRCSVAVAATWIIVSQRKCLLTCCLEEGRNKVPERCVRVRWPFCRREWLFLVKKLLKTANKMWIDTCLSFNIPVNGSQSLGRFFIKTDWNYMCLMHWLSIYITIYLYLYPSLYKYMYKYPVFLETKVAFIIIFSWNRNIPEASC